VNDCLVRVVGVHGAKAQIDHDVLEGDAVARDGRRIVVAPAKALNLA
jgi:hypothetical protein